MHVTVDNSVAVVTMSFEQLQAMRATVEEGATTLSSRLITARSLKQSPQFIRSAARDAREARKLSDALEAAVQKWVRRK